RRSLSGAQPPGTTTASTASAETASTSTSAVASSPFLPCTGWVVSPATVTWAPSSCRRITVTQNSRSSNPSANSTTTPLPSSRPAMSHLQAALLCCYHQAHDDSTLGERGHRGRRPRGRDDVL